MFIISSVEQWLLSKNWFKKGIYDNRWLWGHILGCALIAKLSFLFVGRLYSFLIVLVLAILWEILQALEEKALKRPWDSFFDIFLGMVAAGILLIKIR